MKAFPSEHEVAGTIDLQADGMDLRDYFAAKAMPVYLERWGISSGYSKLETCALVSEWAYAMADAMMKAREQ